MNLLRCLRASDAGEPWPNGGDGSALIRIARIENIDYHVKIPCGPGRDAEPWWGPANELVADLLFVHMGVARPRHALVRFPLAAAGAIRRLHPRAWPQRHPTGLLGYGRQCLAASERWVPWSRISPHEHAWLVAQDIVLHWVGAGADHTVPGKGFLDVPDGPMAIDLGGTDLSAAWERAGATSRREQCDFGGLGSHLASVDRPLIDKAMARVDALEPSTLGDIVGAVPDEWASPTAKDWVIGELRDRQRWLVGWYGQGRSAD